MMEISLNSDTAKIIKACLVNLDNEKTFKNPTERVAIWCLIKELDINGYK